MRETKPLSQALRDFATSLGIDIDNIGEISPPEYTCAVCEDRGSLYRDELDGVAYPYGHENFARLVPCPHCTAGQRLVQRQYELRLKTAGVPAHYSGFSFASFDEQVGQRDGNRLARHACELFAITDGCAISITEATARTGVAQWTRDEIVRNSLVLFGGYGTGKTGLAASAANELIRRGQPVLFTRLDDLVEEIQRGYSDGNSAQILSTYRDAPVLIVDDFAMSSTSPDRLRITESVIRYRHNHNLPTLITCNINQQQFRGMWGDRTSDVLIAMAHWVRCEGPARQYSQELSL